MLLFLDTFILQGCTAISDTVGTISVSCASSHQIQVKALGYYQSSGPVCAVSAGHSPVNVADLQPGGVYNITNNVYFNGQVVLMDLIIRLENVMVMNVGKLILHPRIIAVYNKCK